jgi:hypothetical protein
LPVHAPAAAAIVNTIAMRMVKLICICSFLGRAPSRAQGRPAWIGAGPRSAAVV